MQDVEMKKHAAKQALEDLIDQLLKIEGTLPDDGKEAMKESDSEGEGEGMVEELMEKAMPEMDEDFAEEKKEYFSAPKREAPKKSMTVMMSSGTLPIKAMMKKKK